MLRLSSVLLLLALSLAAQTPTVYLVPNTHGTVSGWLVDFDTERNWVLNNYVDHMDRINRDGKYRLAYSEVPNLITFLQFAPGRLQELKQRIRERKVELTNGFFLEPDVNLSSGEALIQMGVLGLRWYENVFGLRPRHCWMIDLTGCHRQMPQIVAGLGMRDLVFNRNNPTDQTTFWWESPDGTRVLTLVNRHYAEFGLKDGLFAARDGLSEEAFGKMRQAIELKRQHSPSRTSLFSLAGNADYSLSPAAPDYPAAFLREWSRRYPEVEVRFAILDDYVKAIERELETGQTKLETYRGDSGYTWEAFWMNMPEVKQYYRRDEHLLAAAELLSTAASLNAKAPYPSQQFYHSWINLLMNMDRNTIWGASAGMAFQDPAHWDAWDRFRSVEQQARAAIGTAAQAICRTGNSLGVVNALNWKRNDPVELELPPGKAPAKSVCESLAGRVTCILGLPPASLSAVALQNTPPPQANEAPLPASIDTPFYTVTIDPRTGALSSLKLKPTGEELLGGPANEVQMERVGAEQTSPEHFMSARPKRLRVGSSAGFAPHIRSWSGPLSTTVEVSSEFPRQSKLVRTMRFYRNHPRIDFNTRLDLGTSDVLVSVDFPLAGAATERTRGIPYGFADGSPKESVLPAIRWSNYQLATGSGLALLDRGLTGHEFNPNTLTLVFLNAVSKYMKLPNPMLEGRGTREFAYAIVPHAGPWRNAAIPRLAYEFNSPPLAVGSVAQAGAEPLLDTSPNVIVEAVRRVGRQLEVRLYETDGQAGTAELRLNLPHSAATLTNLLGEKPSPLAAVEPNRYRFPIRAQQIVTLRFATATAVAEPQPLRDWAPLVPENKRKALEVHLTGKGHPGGY